ncbi:hypothetical protein [Algoriphagus sp. AK58]|uniref:hypothetical protein n=1 Tax=Algoriphagus sp. AK58 TaxID=1406877 RepID=UPI00165022EA|nr:hypothetical protein [Algoriphagus sp. AK58]
MKKKKLPEEPMATEWDLSEGFGILPNDIPLTQNIGCVGGKPKKPDSSKKEPENKQ